MVQLTEMDGEAWVPSWKGTDIWRVRPFRDHRRAFYLFIGIGAAGQAQKTSLLASLDSLVIRSH